MKIEVDGFGQRLQEERERLNLSLHDFALLGGVGRVTQMRYEAEVNYPSVDYLALLGQHGVDTLFILYGRRDCELIDMTNHQALVLAIEWVEEIMERHNYEPTEEERARAILGVYRQICKFGRKMNKPLLKELIRMSDEYGKGSV
jgi:transcriptional regulator with XRE-family HTH domain